ncbi:hypothetical protein SSX86_009934 [Deinandra increscens subsp. villosa]|uniref:Uncharacterized protein n=1 Tax=Deinandra increscens subsp. villosa TaxID=3103831 RepID=A0AAP0DA37_9ASTR
MEEDPCGNNRSKRKFQEEILEVRVGKHACLATKSHIELDITRNSMSAKDSNNFSEDANSVMSVSLSSSSSSVNNWSGTSKTKTCDAYAFPCFEDCEVSWSEEYETKQSEDDSMEDLFCSNGVLSNNSVLSSGRWNVNQDTKEGGTEKLTIDKEFEQYFSMLML